MSTIGFDKSLLAFKDDEVQIVSTCLICHTDFKQVVNKNEKLQVFRETGYCYLCKLLCKFCAEVNKDDSNDVDLCAKCYVQYMADCNSSDDDSSESEESILTIDSDIAQESTPFLLEDDVMIVNDVLQNLITKVTENVVMVEDILDDIVMDAVKLIMSMNLDKDIEKLNSSIDSIEILDAGPVNTDVLLTAGPNLDFLSIYNESNGRLGSDAIGGSVYGELTPASCKAIGNGLEINENDYFCDIGSGGGLTLTQITYDFKPYCGIGIEIEPIRNNMAKNFQRHFMDKYPNHNIPVAFLNEDVRTFTQLNGVTKVYMFDAEFPPNILERIGVILNHTSTVEFVASTQKLQEFGFNVELYKHLGSLAGRGGNMHHTFYVFKLKQCALRSKFSRAPRDKRLVELISLATDKTRRLIDVNQHMHATENSEVSPRQQIIRRTLGENESPATSKSELSTELFEKLMAKNPTINAIEYKVTFKTPHYVRYNEIQYKSFRVEVGAVANRKEQKALIAPCYDGRPSGDGKILLSIIYDSSRNRGTYYGIVYDISTKSMKERPLTDLYYQFDYSSSMPFNIDAIMQEFRKKYELVTDNPTTNVTGSNNKRQRLEKVIPEPPGVSLRSRKRPLSSNKNIEKVECESSNDEDCEKERPNKRTVIEEKLHANVEKQKKYIVELQNKIKQQQEVIDNFEPQQLITLTTDEASALIDEAIKKTTTYTTTASKLQTDLLLVENELIIEKKERQRESMQREQQQLREDILRKDQLKREEKLRKKQQKREDKIRKEIEKKEEAREQCLKEERRRQEDRIDKQRNDDRDRFLQTIEIGFNNIGKFANR